MNWKQILRTDVTTLLRGFAPPHVYYARHGRAWAGPLYARRANWHRDLLAVTGQLQSIVQCNAPLVQGLELAAWDAPRRKVQLMLQAIHDDLVSGSTLHESLAQRTRFFPKYYVDLVKVGEVTGTLPKSLAHLFSHLTEERKRAASVWGWLGYFAVVLCIQMTIIAFLGLFVLPEFVESLKDLGGQSPAILDRLVRVGDLIHAYWDPVTVALVLLLLVVPTTLLPIRRTTAGVGVRPLKFLGCRVPLLRTAIAKSDLGRVARVLGRLLHAGVPLNDALHDGAELDLATPQRNALQQVKRRIEEGSSLTQAVRETSGFPESFCALVSLGESSGRLGNAFDRIAELYELQTLKTTRVFIDTVCPLGILVLGGIVLAVELSVFSYLTTFADTILGQL